MFSTCHHCSREFFTTSKLALYCTWSCKKKAERVRRLGRDKQMAGLEAVLPLETRVTPEVPDDGGRAVVRDVLEGKKPSDPSDFV